MVVVVAQVVVEHTVKIMLLVREEQVEEAKEHLIQALVLVELEQLILAAAVEAVIYGLQLAVVEMVVQELLK